MIRMQTHSQVAMENEQMRRHQTVGRQLLQPTDHYGEAHHS